MPLGAVAAAPWARQVRGDRHACAGCLSELTTAGRASGPLVRATWPAATPGASPAQPCRSRLRRSARDAQDADALAESLLRYPAAAATAAGAAAGMACARTRGQGCRATRLELRAELRPTICPALCRVSALGPPTHNACKKKLAMSCGSLGSVSRLQRLCVHICPHPAPGMRKTKRIHIQPIALPRACALEYD